VKHLRLSELGLDPDILFLKEKATDTTENARNEFEIAKDKRISKVVVISSIKHFGRNEPKNAIAVFREVIKDFPSIHLCIFTEEY
jgi:uncharacterized SAM-binding protein YcdF (DUF218 family)